MKKMTLCVVTIALISLNWKKMVPFENLVIEVDGVRHRCVKGSPGGDSCVKCSLQTICSNLELGDRFCHTSFDYFVKEQ